MMMLYLRAVTFDASTQIDDSLNRAFFDICVQGLRQRSADLYLAQALFHAIQAPTEDKGVEILPNSSICRSLPLAFVLICL